MLADHTDDSPGEVGIEGVGPFLTQCLDESRLPGILSHAAIAEAVCAQGGDDVPAPLALLAVRLRVLSGNYGV
jgi:hypothetical protein